MAVALTAGELDQAKAAGLSEAEAAMSKNLGVGFEAYASRKKRPEAVEDQVAEQFRMFRELSEAGTLSADQRQEVKRRLGLGGDR